ncbi:uncharacterized protein LOC130447886 [Diorhabda sublineata]|uniref:uncharacterized protein LOC130447886 n=1 Tax=Diorhabda sublineata TaxID=1163346 RepID=UPI0024E0B598|nr:uncharacterized protein LOC130447886 [Diorhabda sublineata]
MSPNIRLEEFQHLLNELKNSMAKRKNKCLICGDFKAKSMMWNSTTNDSRGDILSEWASELNLISLNTGCQPTFRRGQSSSIIYITFAATNIAPLVTNWRVSEEENLTDHNYIYFDIAIKKDSVRTKMKSRGWRVDTTQMDYFINELRSKLPSREQTLKPERLIENISHACDNTFQRKGIPSDRKKPAYWWSAEIAETRKKCLTRKRNMTRLHKKPNISQEQKDTSRQAYKEERARLKNAILRAKQVKWKRVIEEDLWGLGYKIVMNKLSLRSPPALSEELMLDEAANPERRIPRYLENRQIAAHRKTT